MRFLVASRLVWRWLCGLLCLATSSALAEPPAAAPSAATASEATPSSQPHAEDLEGAEEILDASEHDERAEKPDDDSPYLYELRWSFLVTARGGEPETNLTLDDDGFRVEDLLRPRESRIYPSTALAAYAEVEALDWLLFRALVDTREIRDGALLEPPIDGVAINGNAAQDELGSGAVIRELSAVFGVDSFTVEIGRFQAEVADGLVYRDYGSGVRLRADFEAMDLGPFDSELLLTSIGQRVQDIEENQLFALRFDWNLSPFEYISAFVAGSEDRNGEVSEVLRSAYAENLLGDQRALNALFIQEDGGGSQGYLGLAAQVIAIDALTLQAHFVLSGGKLTLQVPPEQILFPEDALESETLEIDVGGIAADVEAHYGLASWIDLAGYAFVLSGDAPPQRGGKRYNSYIGLAPYWTWTGLFFSGGLSSGLYPNRASAAGINGRGVAGIGPGVELTGDQVSAELRAMVLTSTADPPAPPLGGTSRLYGVEFDLTFEWEPLSWLSLGAELDMLIPGGFFASSNLAYLALTRVTVSHGN